MIITILFIYRPPHSNLTTFLYNYYMYFCSDEITIIHFNITINLNIQYSIEFNRITNS